MLEHGTVDDRVGIISALSGNMLAMARHKFASNVCEKALMTADYQSRRRLIAEIMAARPDGQNNIVIMMKDQYASKTPSVDMFVAPEIDFFGSRLRPSTSDPSCGR